MDKQLLQRLTRSIIVKHFKSADLYGDPTYHDEVTNAKAYRHGKIERVTSFSGEEFVSNEQFICDGLYEFSDGDVLISNGRERPIKATSVFDGLIPGTGTTVIYL